MSSTKENGQGGTTVSRMMVCRVSRTWPGISCCNYTFYIRWSPEKVELLPLPTRDSDHLATLNLRDGDDRQNDGELVHLSGIHDISRQQQPGEVISSTSSHFNLSRQNSEPPNDERLVTHNPRRCTRLSAAHDRLTLRQPPVPSLHLDP